MWLLQSEFPCPGPGLPTENQSSGCRAVSSAVFQELKVVRHCEDVWWVEADTDRSGFPPASFYTFKCVLLSFGTSVYFWTPCACVGEPRPVDRATFFSFQNTPQKHSNENTESVESDRGVLCTQHYTLTHEASQAHSFLF